MEPHEREQWKELDQRLAEAEKKLLATANLVRAGVPSHHTCVALC
jgi:hypothetical protein